MLAMHYNSDLKRHLTQAQPPWSLSLPQSTGAVIYHLANSVVTLNLSSDWFPHKQRVGALSAQSLIFDTLSRFECLVDLIYNNNCIKGKSGGPSQFYRALGTCGGNIQFMRVKSCTYSHFLPFEKAF